MQLDLLGGRKRTHTCGELRREHARQSVFLAGWVQRRRDLGNLIFFDLRDHTGITQVVTNRELSPAAHEKAEKVRGEYVIGVEGEVVLRSPETVNAQLSTGEVEVAARTLLVLNEAKTPPFPVEDEARTAEEARLRYRYVDLRRPRMQRNLRLRHQASQIVRQHLSDHGFIELETPFLTRATPEGARDFLVPSRLYPGRFYALPQSPQLFKQLLMIGGFDRYFQIVRCFRDEDFRADRQAEFTQVDVEMAFPARDVLFDIIEQLMEKLFALMDVKVARPFPRLSYNTVIERYGTDKPHLGIGLEWQRVSLAGGAAEKLSVRQPVKALRVPGWAGASRSQLDRLQEKGRESSADWFSYIRLRDSGLESPLVKVVGEEPIRALAAEVLAQPGDLVLLLGLGRRAQTMSKAATASPEVLDHASGELRMEVAEKLGLVKPGAWNFLWVVDFALLEYNEKERRYVAARHPFTSPLEEDLPKLETEPSAVRCQAYDLVLNGSEIGSGSIRIHRRDIQQRVFKALGLSAAESRERFGFLLDALEYGAPPHGGIALGHDRIVALMAGETSIREVIPFPKTASAMDLMCDAPAAVDREQVEALGMDVPLNPRPFNCKKCDWRLRTICPVVPKGVGAALSFWCPNPGCHESYPAPYLRRPYAVQYFDKDLGVWLTDPNQVVK